MSRQQWNPEHYAEHARYVSELGRPVVELLAPQEGERILDLGCGDGALTIELAEAGCDVVAIDSSPEMVAAAKALGLDARVMNGAELPFDDEFDAVFTNATLHWIKEADAVVTGVRRALKPGGRFVGEFGGAGNVATIVAAVESALAARGLTAENPWYFPTAEEYAELLETCGFSVDHAELFPRTTPLPGDIGNWIETFAQPFMAELDAGERSEFVGQVIEALLPSLHNDDGGWVADYVRLRFKATKPR